MVEVGTGSHASRFIKTAWPITEGLTAGTTKLPEQDALIPQEKSLISEREKVGIN